MIVIGLMGPAGAGKSSVAQHLEQKYGAVRYSFAGPLKEMVGRALEFSHEQMWGTQAQKEAVDPRYGHSPRWFLQRIGTEGCRKTFGESFWTEQLISKIKRDRPDLAVIEDARFVNEAAAIREAFDLHITGALARRGFIWRLESPGRETTEANSTHASEQEWKHAPCDHIIAPIERGLPQLFQLVDDVARAMTLFPKRRELPQ